MMRSMLNETVTVTQLSVAVRNDVTSARRAQVGVYAHCTRRAQTDLCVDNFTSVRGVDW